MSRLDASAVVFGALLSLALIVPVALIARLLVGDDEVSAAWNGAFTVFIIVATLIGSGFAARRRPDTAMMHGAAAAVLTYVVARLVSAVISGELPNVLAVVFAVLVFAGIGAIGGFVATTFAGGRRGPASDG